MLEIGGLYHYEWHTVLIGYTVLIQWALKLWPISILKAILFGYSEMHILFFSLAPV